MNVLISRIIKLENNIFIMIKFLVKIQKEKIQF